MVGTWTFTNPDVPLDTACYELRIDGAATVGQISTSAAAVYYGAVEPDGRSILLLHNDIHRSAMSRHRFAVDGSLAEEGRWSSGGQGGSYIAFDPSGRYFVVANAHTGWAVFRNGTEPELIASMRNNGSGPHPRQVRSHPHCAIFTSDNAWIYAADMGSDEVLAFPFDSGAGRVGDKIRAYRAAPGSGPRHLLSRHGLIYLLNELGNTLVALRPEGDGTLTEVQSVSTLPSDFSGDTRDPEAGLVEVRGGRGGQRAADRVHRRATAPAIFLVIAASAPGDGAQPNMSAIAARARSRDRNCPCHKYTPSAAARGPYCTGAATPSGALPLVRAPQPPHSRSIS